MSIAWIPSCVYTTMFHIKQLGFGSPILIGIYGFSFSHLFRLSAYKDHHHMGLQIQLLYVMKKWEENLGSIFFLNHVSAVLVQ